MGFFAAELGTILADHKRDWEWLGTIGIHPTQIQRLSDAADDVTQIATLQDSVRAQIKQDLQLNPLEIAKLKAGGEADTFFRLMIYHHYPLEEAVNKTNAVFAAALKDHLAPTDPNGSIFPASVTPGATPVRRRGRRKAAEVAEANELAARRQQKAAANA